MEGENPKIPQKMKDLLSECVKPLKKTKTNIFGANQSQPTTLSLGRRTTELKICGSCSLARRTNELKTDGSWSLPWCKPV